MNWAFIIAGVIVLMALLSVTRLLRRLFFAFFLAATVGLLLHWQTHPGEASAALAAMGGGSFLAGPLRRIVFRGLL